MRYARLLLVFGLLLIARSAWATCSGVCVQESTVVSASGGTPPNPSLGSNTTAGHAVLALAATTLGTTQISVSGMGATWVNLFDSGSSTSTGNRTVLWCGVVATPAQTLTFTGGSITAGYLMETNKKGCNIATATGAATVGNATSGTSVASFSTATLTSTAVIFAAATHRTSETVTDSNTLTKTNILATNPTVNGDYGTNAGTNSFAYSWTTSSANAWAATAFDDQCTDNDACVEMAPGIHSTTNSNLVVTLPSSPTVGQIVVVKASQGVGNGTIAPIAASGSDVFVNSWTLIGDTGSSGSAGARVFTYCGVVTTTGTTVTLSVSTGGATGLGAVFKGYTCTVDKSAIYNSSTTGVNATVIPSITTTVANDLIIGGGTHRSPEVQTDGSTGFRPLIPFSTTSPVLSMNYEVASGTGTFTTVWSWATAATAAGSIVALEPGTTIAANYTATLLTRVVPISVATPAPPIVPNQGAFYKGTQGASEHCPANLTTVGNAVGCFVLFTWAQLEPQNGVYDWSAVDYALSFSTGSSTPANYPIQVGVLTGDGGTPDIDTVCNSFGYPPNEPPSPPPCLPWLAGIAGVNSHWRAGAVNPGGGHGGLNPCQPTFNPAPWDTTYQAALSAFEAHFEAKYSGTNVSLLSLNVIAPSHNMGMDVDITKQTCQPWSATDFYTTNTVIMPTSNNVGTFNYNETVADCTQGASQPTWNQTVSSTTNDGTCRWTNLGTTVGNFTEYYNSAWNLLAESAPSPGPCSSGDEACWRNVVMSGVQTLLSDLASNMTTIPTVLWITGKNWPAITGGNGATDSDTDPQGMQQRTFNYAQAHQSAAGYYVLNEALKNTGFSSGILSPWISAPNTAKGGAQMVSALSTNGGSCAVLCGALLPCGGCAGIGFAQIYVPDLNNCPTTASDYNEVVNGDSLHLCASVGACTSGVTCSF